MINLISITARLKLYDRMTPHKFDYC